MVEKIDFYSISGYTGLKEYGGNIYEEFSKRLQGPYAQKVYREMSDNSSTIGSIRYIIKALARQVEWRIKPASEVEEAREVAKFVESCILDMSHTFEDFISEVLSFLDYGWSYFEVVYKLRKGNTKNPKTRSKFNDGLIGWRKFCLRAQDTLDRWEFDPDDQGIKGMYQQTEKGQFAFIPIEKSVLFRTETYKNNPEGRSIYRNAVVDWFYLKRIAEIEAIGIERDLAGLPTMEVPLELLQPNASPSNKAIRAQIETMLAQIKRDEREYALVPPETGPNGTPTGYKFKLLTSGGSRQIDTDKTKNYYKIGILQSVVAQFIQLGTQNVGSFALASTQTNMFATALGAYLDMIAATFNRFCIARLMEFNDVDAELWPELVHGDLEDTPLAEIGAYIQALASAGKLPEDAEIQRKLLELASLPVPNIEEEDAQNEQESATPSTPTTKKRAPIRQLAFNFGMDR